jgi:hypothetical protein
MIDEHNVREMLHRRADAVPTPLVDAPKAARRARRRLFANGAVAMLAAGAIAVAALAGVDELRGASVPADQPTPSVTPSTGPFTERFDSLLNGLSIGYPSGWETRPATELWGHGEVSFGSPGVDVIFDPALQEDVYLAVVSEPLGDKSGSDWTYDMLGNLETLGICSRAEGSGGGGGDPFHGYYAWREQCGAPAGTDEILIFGTATRGYIIYLHVADKPRLQATYGLDAAWWKGVLQTVELPEDALNTPDPSASP